MRSARRKAAWYARLRDERAKARINARVFRLSSGNIGDTKAVGDGVAEIRIDYGPGYRVYFIRLEQVIVLLLCGGDKSSQGADIIKANALAAMARKIR